MVDVAPVVAPGGVVHARVSGAGQLQVRSRARWIARAGAFRAPVRSRRLLLRVKRPDGTVSATTVVRVRPLTLDAVGDVNLGDAPGADIRRNGAAYPWRDVGPTLRRADIAVANLECAVSLRGSPQPKRTTFRASPSTLSALRRTGGIDVVSLANNHAGDFGDDALLDSLASLKREGIAAFGAGRDRRTASRHVIVSRLGLKVAFVGFSAVAPRTFGATHDSPGTAWAQPAQVRRAVRTAAAQADVVVTYFHWGVEGRRAESPAQRALARTALAAGATVVLGAHPHVLQPIRRQGSRVVAYSLGNFVFSPRNDVGRRTGILHLALGRHRVLSARLQRADIHGTQPRLRA